MFFLSFFVSTIFLIGVGIGKYELFPHDQLKYVKDVVSGKLKAEAKAKKEAAVQAKAKKQAVQAKAIAEGLRIFDYEIIKKRFRVVKFDSAKEVIDCPPMSESLGVLVTFGQSNSANSASHLFSSSELPDVVNWYDGKCYKASSPLLGASGIEGEWMSQTAQFLVQNGTYTKVIVLSLGIGSSPVAAWAKGSGLNSRLLENLRAITNLYSITDMLWHQGEADLIWQVGTHQYQHSFSSMIDSIREIGVYAPVFISVASVCSPGSYPNEITRAQNNLPSLSDGVVLGVNTDYLITPTMRSDSCHFNKVGQVTAAKEASNIISAYHQSN